LPVTGIPLLFLINGQGNNAKDMPNAQNDPQKEQSGVRIILVM
jgi:hypothetical protein